MVNVRFSEKRWSFPELFSLWICDWLRDREFRFSAMFDTRAMTHRWGLVQFIKTKLRCLKIIWVVFLVRNRQLAGRHHGATNPSIGLLALSLIIRYTIPNVCKCSMVASDGSCYVVALFSGPYYDRLKGWSVDNKPFRHVVAHAHWLG